jgi:hypothetical protein
MELKNLTKLRRQAVLVVVSNVALVLAVAWALPSELHGVLPIVGLVLPLLSLGFIDAAAEARTSQAAPRASDTCRPRFASLRHVAADGGG